MIDVIVKRFDELDGYQPSPGERKPFLYAGKGLGVTSWGMNVLDLPAGYDAYPDHDHVKDGQEEVYIVLEGKATLEAGGQKFMLEPGMLVRVGPAVKRKLVPGGDGAKILALGGTPGKVYELPAWLK